MFRCARLPLLLTALTACALPGCLAPPRDDVVRAVAGISPEALRAHVEALCARGPRPAMDEERSRATLAVLAARLEGLGWQLAEQPFEHEVRVAHPIPGPLDASGAATVIGYGFTYPVRTHRNLIAELRGTSRPDLAFELGAHYDSVGGTPGADDNASGMAVLLEIARVLSVRPPACTVRLCFFALEEEGEDGYMPGSHAHVARMPAAQREGLRAAVVLDMVGYRDRTQASQRFPVRIPWLLSPPRTGDFLLLIGRSRTAHDVRALKRAARRYAPELDTYGIAHLSWLSSDSLRSDHASYWHAGLPAVLLTDTAEYRSPHYHGPSDAPETLDYDFMAAIARTVCAWLIERCEEIAD